jgi:hypothetical protein
MNIELTGGGGNFRFVVSYLLCGKENTVINVNKIRIDRPNPGMHDQIVQTLKAISKYLKCEPEPSVGLQCVKLTRTNVTDEFDLDINTRGSAFLVLQNFTIGLLVLGGKVKVHGVIGGISSPPNIENVIKVLEICDLAKYFIITQKKNSIIMERTSVLFNNPTIKIVNPWTDYTRIPDLKYYWSNPNNKTFYAKSKAEIKTNIMTSKTKKILDWMNKIYDNTGYCPFVYDQLITFAAILGGTVEFPIELEDKINNDEYYDIHAYSLVLILSSIVKINVCMANTIRTLTFEKYI